MYPGGVLNKVYTGSLRHDVQCLTLFCTILTEKVPLSYIPSIYKWYFFNIPGGGGVLGLMFAGYVPLAP